MMLPKKKRWAAAIQHAALGTSCQAAVAPTSAAPLSTDPLNKCQNSAGIQKNQASSSGNNPKAALPCSSSGSHYQPVTMYGLETVSGTEPKPHTVNSRQTNFMNTSSLRIPVPANDPMPNCDLLDQPSGLLLQISQEYLTNLLRVAASGRDCDLSTIPQLMEASYALKGASQDHLTIPHINQTNIRTPHYSVVVPQGEHSSTSPNNLTSSVRMKSPESLKNCTNSNGGRVFSNSRSGVGSQAIDMPTFYTPSVQRFSPHRRSSGGSSNSCEYMLSSHQSANHNKIWSQGQLPLNLHGGVSEPGQVSIGSSVVRTGGLMSPLSPSIISSWDGNTATFGDGIVLDRRQCSPAYSSLPGNTHAPSVLDAGKILNHTDNPTRPKSNMDSSCSVGNSSRNPPLMPSLTPSGHSPLICQKSAMPGSSDPPNRVFPHIPTVHVNRPLHTQTHESPGNSFGHKTLDSADSRLAILQDAKMTALSVIWPNASTTSTLNPGPNSSPRVSLAGGSKVNYRVRSSHSSSSCFPLSGVTAVPATSVTSSPISSSVSPSRCSSNLSSIQRFPTPQLQATGSTWVSTCCSPSAGKHVHHVPLPPGQQPTYVSVPSVTGNSNPNRLLASGNIPFATPATSLPLPMVRLGSMSPVSQAGSRWYPERPLLGVGLQAGDYTVDQSHPPTMPTPMSAEGELMKLPNGLPVTAVQSPAPMTTTAVNADWSFASTSRSSDAVGYHALPKPAEPDYNRTVVSTNSLPAAVGGLECCTVPELRSAMPLKKRLIQRYEADRSEAITSGHPSPPVLPVKMELGEAVHSPISPPSSNLVEVDGQMQLPSVGIKSGTVAFRLGSSEVTSDPSTSVLNSVADGLQLNKSENGIYGGQFKCKNASSKLFKREAASSSHTKPGNDSVTSSPSSGRRHRLQNPEPSTTEGYHCRMTVINGDRLASRAASGSSSNCGSNNCGHERGGRSRGVIQRSTGGEESSASSEEEEGEENSSSFRQFRPHHQQPEQQERKTKRTAALLASATTLGAKIPRLSAKRSKGDFATKNLTSNKSRPHGNSKLQADSGEAKLAEKRFNENVFQSDDDVACDEDAEIASVSTDDTISLLASERKPFGSPGKSVGNELTSVLLENSKSLEDLIDQIPGPPDLHQLTKHSLYLPHSLEHYKTSQTTFIQLVSCNDPGLKQVPKCRACRQLKGVPHFEADLPAPCGAESGDPVGRSDADSLSSVPWSLTKPENSGNDTSVIVEGKDATGIPDTEDNQVNSFKRPSSARQSSHRSDRDKRRASILSKTSANSNNTHQSNPSLETGDRPSGKSERTKQRRASALSPSSVFCRFWGFRKLCFNNRGVLKIADFCQSSEASASDRSLWEMHYPVSPSLNAEAARYILERAGTLFCHLLRQELVFLTGHVDETSLTGTLPSKSSLYHGSNQKNGLRRAPAVTLGGSTVFPSVSSLSITWKRPVKGVREMCDVCETSLFNTHWVCAKCGYSVCILCCDEAKRRIRSPTDKTTGPDIVMKKEQTNFSTFGSSAASARSKQARARAGPHGWASCTTTRQHHDPGRLLLTTLLPATTVGKLLHRVHRIASRFHIRLNCGCSNENPHPDYECSERIPSVSLPSDIHRGDSNCLDLLASLALKGNGVHIDAASPPSSLSSDNEVEGDDWIKRMASGENVTDRLSDDPAFYSWIYKPDPSTTACHSIPLSNTTRTTAGVEEAIPSSQAVCRKYRILRLSCPDHPANLEAFQHEWRRSRPVIVSGCQVNFDAKLWSPRRFAEDFGQLRTVLVDCATGVELTRYPLRTFWEGFERKNKRLVSKDGRALCLKLKDWPTMDDFAELQPERFLDLMNHLPLSIYTGRDGQFNLASRLPTFFVCPDLGPKLYVAYGTGGSRSMGTTNLHVDIADAVNLLLYVGHPVDSVEESTANAEAVLTVIRQANVDASFIDRAVSWMRRSLQTSPGAGCSFISSEAANHCDEKDTDSGPPGALWHIFLPDDMAAVREFLTHITEEETGAPLEPGSDPIHDQQIYLDQPLLDRLYSCTGILPCTIVQFYGDAVFIPAGAAHQVRNLNSCIKAAVDFVSPEHLGRCFQLSEQFRCLSSTHQNREDKLQVKNMLFHGVKDALSVLLMTVRGTDNASSVTQDKLEEQAGIAHQIVEKINSGPQSSSHPPPDAKPCNTGNDDCPMIDDPIVDNCPYQPSGSTSSALTRPEKNEKYSKYKSSRSQCFFPSPSSATQV